MPEDEPMLAVPVSTQRDHVMGRSATAVTLVEYGDFECSYCGQAYPVVKEVVGEFLEQLDQGQTESGPGAAVMALPQE